MEQRDEERSAPPHQGEVRNVAWQLCLLVLGLFVLGTLAFESILIEDRQTAQVLQRIDLLVCLIFLVDFIVRLSRAPDRWRYFRSWGWIDLASSIPSIDLLRLGRLARLGRTIQVLRALKSMRVLGESVSASKFETLTASIFLIVFLSFALSAGLILSIEEGYQSPVSNASEAMWWAALSILNAKTGVVVPISAVGVLLTVYLNKIGLLIFAYANATIIAWLVQARKTSREATGGFALQDNS